MVCFRSPGDLQALFLHTLSLQCMEEGKEESAQSGSFSRPCPSPGSCVGEMGMEGKTTLGGSKFQRDLSLCFPWIHLGENYMSKELAERRRKKAQCCMQR